MLAPTPFASRYECAGQARPFFTALYVLQHFLQRNGLPHMGLDVGDADTIASLERLTPPCDDMPLVICQDGTATQSG
jgi:hypothetical protein